MGAPATYERECDGNMIPDRRNDISVWAAAILLVGAWMPGCLPQRRGLVTNPARAVADARETLFQATTDPDGITRSHAIEALDYTIGIEAGEYFLAGLDDSVASVRFAAAMAIGETGYAPAKAKLLAMAGGEEGDKRVLCGVIYAMYRLGDDSQMSRLAKFLDNAHPWVRANAAFIMGKSGHPSAMQVLKDLGVDERNVDVLIRARESLAMLGDTASAIQLEGDTMGQFDDDRIDAIRALSRLGGPGARQQLEYLTERTDLSALVRVAAAGGLGRMGVFSRVGYDLCIDAVTKPSIVLKESADRDQAPNEADIRGLQQLAAVSLGLIGRPAAVDHLYRLLGKRDPRIRVAAARGILQLLPSYGQTGPETGITEPDSP